MPITGQPTEADVAAGVARCIAYLRGVQHGYAGASDAERHVMATRVQRIAAVLADIQTDNNAHTDADVRFLAVRRVIDAARSNIIESAESEDEHLYVLGRVADATIADVRRVAPEHGAALAQARHAVIAAMRDAQRGKLNYAVFVLDNVLGMGRTDTEANRKSAGLNFTRRSIGSRRRDPKAPR
jgi:hypothetical protein